MQLLVSVIIVNWNAKDYIEQCIDSILSQTYQNFEIILVDNASSDNSVKIVQQKYPQVKIIQNKENLGFAEANNIGINNSSGSIIALFNPDAVAEKNWLQRLIDVITHSDDVGGVAGKILYLGDKYGKDAVFCTWSKIDPFTANPTNYFDNEPISKVDYLSGAAMLVKRDILEKIGALDTDYFLYFEETDLCARMIRAGYDLIYVPTAIVWHAVSPLSNSEKKIYYMERNRFRFAVKNFDIVYIPIFVFCYLAESLAIFLKDVKLGNIKRTKIRAAAIKWNILNLHKTWKCRQNHMIALKKSFRIRSYNRSLPLRNLQN